MKKSIRARVTSTSFYHPSHKERDRERIKTEEEIPERHLEKSFIVTKYGLGFAPKRSKEDPNLYSIRKQ